MPTAGGRKSLPIYRHEESYHALEATQFFGPLGSASRTFQKLRSINTTQFIYEDQQEFDGSKDKVSIDTCKCALRQRTPLNAQRNYSHSSRSHTNDELFIHLRMAVSKRRRPSGEKNMSFNLYALQPIQISHHSKRESSIVNSTNSEKETMSSGFDFPSRVW